MPTKKKFVPDVPCRGCGQLTPSKKNGSPRFYCSRKCAFNYVRAQSHSKHARNCIDCGAEFLANASSRRQRCDKCRVVHTEKYYQLAAESRKSSRRVSSGEGPYADYLVFGPVFKLGKWYVTLAHKGNSFSREMTLAHYKLSVASNRRLLGTEPIGYKDGNPLNTDPSNLELLPEPPVLTVQRKTAASVKPKTPSAELLTLARKAADAIDREQGKVSLTDIVARLKRDGHEELLKNVNTNCIPSIFRFGWNRIGVESTGYQNRPVGVWSRAVTKPRISAHVDLFDKVVDCPTCGWGMPSKHADDCTLRDLASVVLTAVPDATAQSAVSSFVNALVDGLNKYYTSGPGVRIVGAMP